MGLKRVDGTESFLDVGQHCRNETVTRYAILNYHRSGEKGGISSIVAAPYLVGLARIQSITLSNNWTAARRPPHFCAIWVTSEGCGEQAGASGGISDRGGKFDKFYMTTRYRLE